MPAARTRSRARRWLLGIAIGIAGLVVLAGLAVVGVVIAFQIHSGRELVRAQVEQRLAAAFTGGATLGGIDGNPLGELTLHDLVIHGPEGRPAITVRTLTVELGLLALASREVRVAQLRVEDVDLTLARDASGELAIRRLLKPGPKSTWSVELQRLAIRRGHVRLDTGDGPMNFDGLVFDGWAKLSHGGPIDAGADLRGTWRERASAALALHAVLHAGGHGVALPELSVRAGDVSVAGRDVQIGSPAVAGRAPVLGGTLDVNAPAAAVSRLVPTVHLPADLAVRITATPVPGQPWTQLAVTGRVDQTPVRFTGAADLDDRRARGELSTGTLDLTRLSGGRIEGTAGATGTFDVRLGAPGALPTATATIHGWGEVDGAPRIDLDVALSSLGERARGVIDARGRGLRAELAADLHIAGERLEIEGATLHAIADPARASGGKAPIHGGLRIDLAAHGALRPSPRLAVRGTIDGEALRTRDVSASALHVAIDARHLPSRPYGHAHVQLVDLVLVRRNMQLGELSLDASDRPDGKIAVAMRSRPRQSPWQIDADALVTPPGDLGAGRVAIDLVHHRVRAGSGAEWTGHTGHLDIGPERIALRDLQSGSQIGHLALAGSYERAGRRKGDLTANVDATSLLLASIAATYAGKASAHVAVARRAGVWQGDAMVDGKGLAIDPSSPSGPRLDARAHVALHGRRLTVAADAASADLGTARLSLDVDAPAAVSDPAAWKRLGRGAVRTGELTLRGIEIRRAAALAGLAGDYAGRVNADLAISPSDATGKLEVNHLVAPSLRGLPVDAVLELSQPTATELAPKLAAKAEGLGSATAEVRLAMPDRPFDPATWRALGRGALHGATVRIADVAVDPAMLERFGVRSPLRGRIGAAIDVGEAAHSVDATIDVGALRGGPIVQPIDVHVTAGADERETTAALTVATAGGTLVEASGRIPVPLAQVADLWGKPGAVRNTPLSATARLASVDPARLLAVFGRSEITGGRLDGSVRLAGTLGRPKVTANLVATQLQVPPGPRGTPVRIVDRLAVTGSWDGETARLDLHGAESHGGTLDATAVARPGALRNATLTVKATKFDLVPVLAFAPGPAGGAAGQLDADLRVTGLTLRESRIAGELHLTGGRIPTAPTVGTLRDARIDAVVADREVRLRASGKLGGGSATLDGTVALDGAVPNGGTVKITLRNVSPIGSIEPQITADLTGTLSRDRSRWIADLVVDQGTVVVPKDRGEKLKPVGAPSDMRFASGPRVPGRPVARPAPASPIFVVKLDIRPTRVESEEFRGEIRGRLELRTDGEAVALVGGVEADGGDLELFGRRYAVERAAVRFDGSLDPLLDIRITHDFPEVTTVTEVHGSASKPELEMSSDPGTYSQGQLLGFLLGGEPSGEPSGSVGSQAAAAGASYVASKIGGYVKKALPVDIDVLSYQAATATSSAAVTVGTWVTPSLFLAYRQRLESRPDENTGEGELEYRLTRRLVLEGTVGNRGYDSIDLVWRKRY